MISEKNKIAAILALALALRITGIGFGLPDVYHQDEPILVNHALSIGAGGWNTHFFIIPPFTIYLLFAAQAVYFCVGKLFGVFGTPSDFALMFLKDPSFVYLLGRSLVGVFFGTATVWVLWLGSRRFFGERTAFWAALFLAVLPIHVRHSHYIYADIPMTFVVTCAFFILLAILETPSLANYLRFGALLGWAASIKYTALFFAPTLLAVHFTVQKKEGFRPPQLLKLVLSGAGCIATFLLFAPFSLLDWKNFSAQLFHQSGAEGFVGFSHHVVYSIAGGSGILFTLLAVLGLVILLRTSRAKGVVAAAFLLAYYFVCVYFSQRFERYMLPLVPLLALLSAVALETVLLFLRSKRSWVTLFVVILFLELLPPSVYLDVLFLRTDTRSQCAAWFQEHAEPGGVVVVDSRFFGPYLPPSESQVREKYAELGDSEKDNIRKKRLDYQLRASAEKKTYDSYLLIASGGQVISPTLFSGPFVEESPEAFKKIGARYLVVHYQSRGEEPSRILKTLSDKASLVGSFSPYRDVSRKFSSDPEASTAAPHLAAEIYSRKSLGPYLEVYRIHE